MMYDPIADMLTRIRNANREFKEFVDIPFSTEKNSVAKVLFSEGYIVKYETIELGIKKVLRVYLKYGAGRERIISDLKRISKPGVRFYVKNNKVPKVLNGLGIAVISTSQGVMSDREARKLKIGGEVVAYIW
ncbi:MAG: 30S ribosomal protein S8 [candidate division WS2 bacterium]|uniref:Small ribosomal subunit protein uS8 n=1 Tax=Psychracetigena formicireducens TaxID=2986056 RepID=A0A9E2BIA8_PSYF1|nr:30S ribosomal protein S8 [Candidatus Psychracetigena formicireducens]MBT9144670.1 30S ribosomal protein S8 [Candidatus Psychracetigena formicireducens]MBT9150208.1 30S ribosomal protein S8 [Candidatus Psychracetigena formicireducens]